jgi:hypothetical protein
VSQASSRIPDLRPHTCTTLHLPGPGAAPDTPGQHGCAAAAPTPMGRPRVPPTFYYHESCAVPRQGWAHQPLSRKGSERAAKLALHFRRSAQAVDLGTRGPDVPLTRPNIRDIQAPSHLLSIILVGSKCSPLRPQGNRIQSYATCRVDWCQIPYFYLSNTTCYHEAPRARCGCRGLRSA